MDVSLKNEYFTSIVSILDKTDGTDQKISVNVFNNFSSQLHSDVRISKDIDIYKAQSLLNKMYKNLGKNEETAEKMKSVANDVLEEANARTQARQKEEKEINGKVYSVLNVLDGTDGENDNNIDLNVWNDFAKKEGLIKTDKDLTKSEARELLNKKIKEDENKIEKASNMLNSANITSDKQKKIFSALDFLDNLDGSKDKKINSTKWNIFAIKEGLEKTEKDITIKEAEELINKKIQQNENVNYESFKNNAEKVRNDLSSLDLILNYLNDDIDSNYKKIKADNWNRLAKPFNIETTDKDLEVSEAKELLIKALENTDDKNLASKIEETANDLSLSDSFNKDKNVEKALKCLDKSDKKCDNVISAEKWNEFAKELKLPRTKGDIKIEDARKILNEALAKSKDSSLTAFSFYDYASYLEDPISYNFWHPY